MADPQIEQFISTFLRGIEGRPSYARNLIGLAEVVSGRKESFRAFQLARQALDAASGDPDAETRARALLGSFLPAYHVPMMNDARRNDAWDRALRNAIRPGMRVLEIGTGAGMLALMAARAGAEKVTTCERDPIAATLAREICERNGYGSIIDVIAQRSHDLTPGTDFERPADLVFCDIFGDTLLDFDPLAALTDARNRLVVPAAPVVPACGSIMLALASWNGCATACRAGNAAGFDITPFGGMVRQCVRVDIGDPGLALHSSEQEAFRFDFALPSHPGAGRSELNLEADRDGAVDGVVQWIRLQLDAETVLEARPEPGAAFFSAPRFWPLPESLEMQRGESLGVVAEFAGTRFSIRAVRG